MEIIARDAAAQGEDARVTLALVSGCLVLKPGRQFVFKGSPVKVALLTLDREAHNVLYFLI